MAHYAFLDENYIVTEVIVGRGRTWTYDGKDWAPGTAIGATGATGAQGA